MTTKNNNPIAVMQRVELKYVLNAAQTAYIKQRLADYMQADRYGLTSIVSLYIVPFVISSGM